MFFFVTDKEAHSRLVIAIEIELKNERERNVTSNSQKASR